MEVNLEKSFQPEIFVPGLRLKLVALSQVKSRLVTHVVGYKANKYIVAEYPLVSGSFARMEEGLGWAANFVHEGIIFGFTTYILGSIKHPIPLIFLSYPDSVERIELRQTQRYPVQIKAVYSFETPSPESDHRPNQATVRDISEGGCLLASPVSHPMETVLNLDLDLPAQGTIKGVAAEVKSCREEAGEYLLGLSFADMTDEGLEKIRAYTKSLEAMALRF